MSKGDRDAEHPKTRLIQRWPLTTCLPSTGEWEGEVVCVCGGGLLCWDAQQTGAQVTVHVFPQL